MSVTTTQAGARTSIAARASSSCSGPHHADRAAARVRIPCAEVNKAGRRPSRPNHCGARDYGHTGAPSGADAMAGQPSKARPCQSPAAGRSLTRTDLVRTSTGSERATPELFRARCERQHTHCKTVGCPRTTLRPCQSFPSRSAASRVLPSGSPSRLTAIRLALHHLRPSYSCCAR